LEKRRSKNRKRRMIMGVKMILEIKPK